MDCQLCPAAESDREFLYDLYCQTMREVVEGTWGWDDAWQRQDFQRRFDACRTFVVRSETGPVGGLLLNSTASSIDIVELQILPAYQGMGMGTAILKRLIDQAGRDGVDLTLSVAAANTRARLLYERLGFEVIGVDTPFIRMRCRHLATRGDRSK